MLVPLAVDYIREDKLDLWNPFHRQWTISEKTNWTSGFHFIGSGLYQRRQTGPLDSISSAVDYIREDKLDLWIPFHQQWTISEKTNWTSGFHFIGRGLYQRRQTGPLDSISSAVDYIREDKLDLWIPFLPHTNQGPATQGVTCNVDCPVLTHTNQRSATQGVTYNVHCSVLTHTNQGPATQESYLQCPLLCSNTY